jgi:3-oxoacyl-[acyl-carrier protein] reductase
MGHEHHAASGEADGVRHFLVDPGLSGRHVLVTGANNPRGIGAATARAFARLGCPVFLHYFREPAPTSRPEEIPGEPFYQELRSRTAQEVVDDIERAGGRASAREADLAAEGSARQLLDRAEACFGPVQVLVNNAAHPLRVRHLPAERRPDVRRGCARGSGAAEP